MHGHGFTKSVAVLLTALFCCSRAALPAAEQTAPTTPTPTPAPPAPSVVQPKPPALRTLNAGALRTPSPAWKAPQNSGPEPLVFDALLKEHVAKEGETQALLNFSLTNISSMEVVINNVRTSCGCTVPTLPSRPWRLPPGASGSFGVAVDLRGKFGILTKSVFVDIAEAAAASSAPPGASNVLAVPGSLVVTNVAASPGLPALTNTSLSATNIAAAAPLKTWMKPLTVRVTLPQKPLVANAMDDRVRNMQLAMADRQIVFKGECAKCHSEPTKEKTGLALYQAGCAICHDSHNRATMVPDLRALKHPTDREHWIKWTAFGRPGSLMPAFAQSEGGPLTEEQIDSLADYLTTTISQKPRNVVSKSSPQLPPAPPALPRPQTKP
jgi:mono/diheme cytochrome c family protein